MNPPHGARSMEHGVTAKDKDHIEESVRRGAWCLAPGVNCGPAGFLSMPHALCAMLLGSLLMVIFLGFPLTPAHAINEQAGTSGGRFFKLNFGARAQAMGGAYTSTTDDLFASQWNPSSSAFMEKSQFVAQHSELLADIEAQYVAFGPINIGTRRTNLDFFAGSLDKGDLVGTAETNSGGFAGFTGSFEASDLKAGVGLSHRFTRSFGAGVSLKYLRSSIAEFDADAMALDVGMQYEVTPNFRFGGAIRNLGDGIQFVDQEDPLPLTVGIGTSYQTRFNSYLGYEASLDLRKPRDDDLGIHFGNELSISEMVGVRLGYNTSDELEDGLSFGLGFQVSRFGVDYAYVPSGDVFDNRQKFSLSVSF